MKTYTVENPRIMTPLLQSILTYDRQFLITPRRLIKLIPI